MKIKIDIYIKNILRENLVYFLAFTFFILVSYFFIPGQIDEYKALSEKITKTKSEISDLSKKNAIIKTYSPSEIKKLVAVLNRLVPQNEDYFSIFQTLENLSKKTGFKIISYSIGITEGETGKISLGIGSEGTPDSFLKFLESYRFEGGRLITMDSIKFVPNTSLSKLTVNLYSKDIKARGSTGIPKIDQKVIEEVSNIAEKIGNVEDSETAAAFGVDYTGKENPFE